MSASSSKPTNLREVYFPHEHLTKVIGIPTYSDIQRTQSEVLANLNSISTHLGGGMNGHVGLGMTPTA